MLHHFDPISSSDHGRGTGWSRRYRQDGNYKGFGPGTWNNGVRVQLLRADGLQVRREYLQRVGSVRSVGVFRRVQPHLSRSPFCRSCSGQIHSGSGLTSGIRSRNGMGFFGIIFPIFILKKSKTENLNISRFCGVGRDFFVYPASFFD